MIVESTYPNCSPQPRLSSLNVELPVPIMLGVVLTSSAVAADPSMIPTA